MNEDMRDLAASKRWEMKVKSESRETLWKPRQKRKEIIFFSSFLDNQRILVVKLSFLLEDFWLSF